MSHFQDRKCPNFKTENVPTSRLKLSQFPGSNRLNFEIKNLHFNTIQFKNSRFDDLSTLRGAII